MVVLTPSVTELRCTVWFVAFPDVVKVRQQLASLKLGDGRPAPGMVSFQMVPGKRELHDAASVNTCEVHGEDTSELCDNLWSLDAAIEYDDISPWLPCRGTKAFTLACACTYLLVRLGTLISGGTRVGDVGRHCFMFF